MRTSKNPAFLTVLNSSTANGSRTHLHQTGENRARWFRRGFQRREQPHPANRCYQDHRSGTGARRDRRYQARDNGSLAVRQSLRHEILRLLLKGQYLV
ncbi:hypothetical protein AVEN_105556-1 [Araneus ventricosus]|uniref:Uncharacterized protein n=1 Tax=Araneus ventricosus TaxID=182803 RepID=A0A4Y2EU38_ARAVE|nr:hypothetical protein AVEN_105556-1 [Araneus ventricosus]